MQSEAKWKWKRTRNTSRYAFCFGYLATVNKKGCSLLSVLHTYSNQLLLRNQDKGEPTSVADPLPLPLGPALHTVSDVIWLMPKLPTQERGRNPSGSWLVRNQPESSLLYVCKQLGTGEQLIQYWVVRIHSCRQQKNFALGKSAPSWLFPVYWNFIKNHMWCNPAKWVRSC